MLLLIINIFKTQAMLMWTVPKHRRVEGGFLGHATIAAQLADKSLVTRKLRGITGMKAPARDGTEIWSADESTQIGA